MTEIDDQKMFEAMKEYEEEMLRLDQEEAKKRNECLDQIKKLITEKQYEELIEFIQEDGYTHNFKLVNKKGVSGSKQEEEYWFKYIYITQSTGYAEDDFYGTIFIPIKRNLYLHFQYSM